TADLSTSRIPDHPGVEVLLTSANFEVREGSTTFRTDRSSTAVADAWVRAIEGATESIHIASGHLRLRPVAEALIARRQADPDLDIRVYLDQQEFISASGDQAQAQAVEECLAEASTDLQRWNCQNKSFLWGRQVGEAGVDVRYKAYSYRWDHSYAVQMHHKYMVIDGDELLTGSYNLSINAEHATFENSLHLTGPEHAGLIAAYEGNFEAIWQTGRAEGLLDDLRDEIATAEVIPLVFEPMALTWDEYSALRGLIMDECPQVSSEEFRRDPAGHRTCPRP
ncbi:MAG TPA: phospholipase D-like domain-containing protein, partial [Kofleriaceae bacterium]|nr:phospholipase D-like domain-containing protein [Kofleriaceae bacterium]